MHPFSRRRGGSPTLKQVAEAVLANWNLTHPDMPMKFGEAPSWAKEVNGEPTAFTFARLDGTAHYIGIRWSHKDPGRTIETFYAKGGKSQAQIEFSAPDLIQGLTGILYERRGDPYGVDDVMDTLQSALDANPALRDAFRIKHAAPYPGVSDHHRIELWPQRRISGCLIHGVRVRVEDFRARVEILRHGYEDLGDRLVVRPLLGAEIRPWHAPTSAFLAVDLLAGLQANPNSFEPWVGLNQGTHPRTREAHAEVKAALDTLNENHPGDEQLGPMLTLHLNDDKNLKPGQPDILGFTFFDGTKMPLAIRVGDEGVDVIASDGSGAVATFDYMGGLAGLREEIVRFAEPCMAQGPSFPVWG